MRTFGQILRGHLEGGTQAGKTGVPWTHADFAEAVEVDVKQIGRLLAGTARPRQEKLKAIEARLFGPDPCSDERYELRRSLEEGLWWRYALRSASGEHTKWIFDERLQGTWENFHYGFSQIPSRRTRNPLLSLSLLHVHGINASDPKVIDCTWTDLDHEDRQITHEGHVINCNDVLYFFSEPTGKSEIGVYCAHLPSTRADIIFGVTANVSGYGRQHERTPSAARFAFRRLGSLEASCSEIRKRCVLDLVRLGAGGIEDAKKMHEFLRTKVGGYVDPKKLGKGRLSKDTAVTKEMTVIAKKIRNVIPRGQIPFVLRPPP